MIHDRKCESAVAGPVFGMIYAFACCCSAYALGGVINPISVIGGFLVTTVEMNQIPLVVIPFIGAAAGQIIYKYVLMSEDVGAIFAEDETEHDSG